MNKNKGFTLIELLVVVAIIGILSGIVLSSLGTARNKAKDAAIQSELSSLRVQAEIFYGTGNAFTGMCSDTAVLNIINKINADNGSGAAPTCSADANTWAASAPLNIGGTFCVDSNGTAKSGSVVTGSGPYSCS